VLWLFEQYFGENPKQGQPDIEFYGSVDDQLAYSIGTLFKHAKHYMKTALKDTALKNDSDFAYLASLQNYPDLKKSELIELNLQEFSSGMEVIRRLIKQGFIEDYDDPNDGRSKRVRITEEGKNQFQIALKSMQDVSTIIGGPLSNKEKAKLLGPLNILLRFHRPIWKEEHGDNLKDIINKHELN
jgi:DNA-binding MarR family transcriptional regulator